jgi:hypothetical protein
MTRPTKAPRPPAAPPRPEPEPDDGPWQTPPETTAERLQRITTLGRRIHEYVQFMRRVGKLNGTSSEAREKAVAAFYEQMALLERQLSRIQEDLRLG